ncbi:MAG: hypothetical protein A3I00_02890 [Betaproteobacteria bacterium RIFCSPLOWO2_02_FULL_64_12]|nr:MAG: hypothetical protein A3I00_02890 [Betaproteobacteria bacterium RIFCSPLOWO2_02_FULL_64_12]
MSRDWLLYLDDLIDSAEKIQRFVRGRSFQTFSSDEMLFDAVLFNLEVIGEAVKKLPEEAKSSAPDANWTGPARMRDLIAHHYFSVDPQIVWEAATQHIPKILGHAKQLRERFDQGGEGSGIPG